MLASIVRCNGVLDGASALTTKYPLLKKDWAPGLQSHFAQAFHGVEQVLSIYIVKAPIQSLRFPSILLSVLESLDRLFGREPSKPVRNRLQLAY